MDGDEDSDGGDGEPVWTGSSPVSDGDLLDAADTVETTEDGICSDCIICVKADMLLPLPFLFCRTIMWHISGRSRRKYG